jgi:prepilin-type N-terminal cleavage/methylation domain-containing protein
MKRCSAARTLLKERGFSLLEILVVMFILCLIFGVGIVSFAKLVKTSKIQQAVEAVMTALWNTRAEAQTHRAVACLFYGDDASGLKTAPLPGVLPAFGRMEIWTVGTTQAQRPQNIFAASSPPPWYPYHYKQKCLSPQPLTLPPGIRAQAGRYTRTPAARTFAFPDVLNTGPHAAIGELRRHNTPFWRTGGGIWAWENTDVIVWEPATGEHAVIHACETYGGARNSRPRIETRALTHIGTTKLVSHQEINGLMDRY